jgi:hypothetical protein
MNRLKQFAIMAVIAVAIIGAFAFAVITTNNSNQGTITIHGG